MCDRIAQRSSEPRLGYDLSAVGHMALPGIVALLIFVYVRPHELIPGLDRVPALPMLLMTIAIGVAVDSRVRLARGPQSGWIAAFFAWGALSIIATSPFDEMTGKFISHVTPIGIAILLTWCIPNFRGLAAAGLTIALCCGFVTLVAIDQGRQPLSCVAFDPMQARGEAYEPDGRSCTTRIDCYETGKPELEYDCEHVGKLSTTSVGGRVRYRGIFNDPNELALAIGVALPLLFAFASQRRGILWKLAPPLAVGLVAVCLHMTQSRSGVLVLITVLGVYLINRYRTLGALAAIGIAIVIPMIGGRADAGGADESTLDRYEAWRTALDLIRSHPVMGVGFDRFQDYHLLTAHNSYLLVPAELGLPGQFMWLAVLCISLSTPLSVLRQLPDQGHPDVLPARTWGLALTASFAGLAVGMLFFSLAYHELIWIYVGLSGAYYRAVAQSFPQISVRLRLFGLAAIGLLAIGILGVFSILLKWKGY